jgi:hypothetical protein
MRYRCSRKYRALVDESVRSVVGGARRTNRRARVFCTAQLLTRAHSWIVKTHMSRTREHAAFMCMARSLLGVPGSQLTTLCEITEFLRLRRRQLMIARGTVFHVVGDVSDCWSEAERYGDYSFGTE